MRQHLDIKIYGRVQGVAFRYFLKEKAEKLGINGWAKNLSDGPVYVKAEGEEENLKIFLKFCRQGPSYALVEKVEDEVGQVEDFKSFKIL